MRGNLAELLRGGGSSPPEDLAILTLKREKKFKVCPEVGKNYAQLWGKVLRWGGGVNFARASRAQALLILPPLANFGSMPLYIYM